MLSLLFLFLQLALIFGCIVATIVFIVLAIIKRKKQKLRNIFLFLSLLFALVGISIYNVDLTSAETENRDESVEAFEQNFGFSPPSKIKEIKHKNFFLYDADAHWMTFTYDSLVFTKILEHDKPLQNALQNTGEFQEISSSLKKGCANCPNWLILPNDNTPNIYHKKDFLDHTNSEYYLWINKETKMVYLEVSYFD